MYEYRFKLRKVTDGDTILAELDLGFNSFIVRSIRLLGVDTPEVYGPHAEVAGKVASEFTKTWFARWPGEWFRYVSVKYDMKEKYGRSLGWVYSPSGEELGQQLKAARLVK